MMAMILKTMATNPLTGMKFSQLERTSKAEDHDEDSDGGQQLRGKSWRATSTKGTTMAALFRMSLTKLFSSRFLVLIASCVSDREILLIMPPVKQTQHEDGYMSMMMILIHGNVKHD